MPYSVEVEKALRGRKLQPGDSVRLTRSDGEVFEGVLLPRIEVGDSGAIVVKLDSGYNVGVRFSRALKIEKLESARAVLGRFEKAVFERRSGLPKISLIATGGTIASRIDYRTGGVHMLLEPGEILSTVPELADYVELKQVLSPFRMASEDLAPAQWGAIARETAKQLNSGASGVIVTHGTDTLHYTAAALSFMLKGRKPVALVGAQRSPDRASFDGALNLLCGAHYAASDYGEVAVVMHGSANDDYCYAHRGTKARKMHASARNAFQSINAEPLCRIWPDGKILQLNEDAKRREGGKVSVSDKFEEKVALLKVFPGSDPALVDWHVEKKYKGLVIEGTGLGHVPTMPERKEKSWIPAVERAVEKGVVVAVTSQALYGRSNPYVYTNLRLLWQAGAVHCEDTLPETALVKLGWLLANEKNKEKVRKAMRENLVGEINSRLQEADWK